MADDKPQILPLRRIVTGYDARGRAIITMDGEPPRRNVRPGGTVSSLIWGSDECPAEVWTDEDFGDRDNVIEPGPEGSWFRIVDFPAGAPGRMHRTETVDYAICMQGECDMEMDDGLTVTVRAGDILVQQATNHSWINRGTETCRIAFVLIDSKEPPAGRAGPGGQPLAPLWPFEGEEFLPPVRRIVTTHDADGKAIVMSDGPAPQRVKRARGNVSTLIWGGDETPAEVWTAEDFGLRENEIEPPPRGNWCRVIDYPPGPGRMHRTDTVDYIVCLTGEIDMELDDGHEVHMKAGDVMIQQATNHSWINRGTETCRIVFVLLDGKKKPA